MLAELLARPQEPVHPDRRPRFEIGQAPHQLQRFGAGRLELPPRLLRGLAGRLAIRVERHPLRDQRLPLAVQRVHVLAQPLPLRPQPFLAVGQVAGHRVQRGGPVVQLLADDFQLGGLALTLFLDGPRQLLQAGHVGPQLLLLLGQRLLPLAQLLGTPPQLLLQRRERLLGLGQRRLAVAQRPPVGRQAALQFLQLGRAGRDQPGLLRLLRRRRVLPRLALVQLLLLSFQRCLRLPQLGHGRVHRRPALLEAAPLLLVQEAVVVQLLAQPARLVLPRLEVRFGRLLHGPLVAQRLLLPPHLLAHPLHARPQCGQHRLLTFQRRRPLLDLGRGRLVGLLLPGEFLHLHGLFFVELVHLHGLLFEVAQVALQLFVALVHLQRPRLQLLLPLLQLGLDAVEPHEVGLVLLLPPLQGRAVLHDLLLALLALLHAIRELAL